MRPVKSRVVVALAFLLLGRCCISCPFSSGGAAFSLSRVVVFVAFSHTLRWSVAVFLTLYIAWCSLLPPPLLCCFGWSYVPILLWCGVSPLPWRWFLVSTFCWCYSCPPSIFAVVGVGWKKENSTKSSYKPNWKMMYFTAKRWSLAFLPLGVGWCLPSGPSFFLNPALGGCSCFFVVVTLVVGTCRDRKEWETWNGRKTCKIQNKENNEKKYQYMEKKWNKWSETARLSKRDFF